jgi:hypothetical protein
MKWQYVPTALFTDMELRKFHRSYGYASVDKIIAALEEAGYEGLPPGTREKLADITRRCEPCQHTATKPRHFSISLNWQGARFNHVVQVNVVHFQTEPFSMLLTLLQVSTQRILPKVYSILLVKRFGTPSKAVG